MGRRGKITGWLAALFAALLLAACGSGGGGGSVNETDISHAQALKQGDAACTKAADGVSAGFAEEAERLAGKSGELDEAAQEELLETITGPEIQKMAEALAAIGAPEGEGEQVEAIVEGFEEAAATLQEEPAKGIEEDVLSPAAKKAGAFGYTSCAQF